MMGTKLGYYDPTNWKEAYYCDVILDWYPDVLAPVCGLIIKGEGDPMSEELQAKAKEAIDKFGTPGFECCEKQLEEHGGPYIAGARLTIADCLMCALLANMAENLSAAWNAPDAIAARALPSLARVPGTLSKQTLGHTRKIVRLFGGQQPLVGAGISSERGTLVDKKRPASARVAATGGP